MFQICFSETIFSFLSYCRCILVLYILTPVWKFHYGILMYDYAHVISRRNIW